jgi:HAD superfamily hydrolase (TIGR01450 family)
MPANDQLVSSLDVAPAPDLLQRGGRPEVVLLDLDGVVWLAHQAIPGSVEGIAALRSEGVRVLFVTNNSASTEAEQVAALGAIGVPAEGDVLTSAMAGAMLVVAGERVLVCGGPGVAEAVERRGATPVTEGPCDAVMVGFHRSFTYERLRLAAAAVHAGARLIGTNDDATYPTPDGPIPGGGAILAAVEVGSGTKAVVAGKPFEPMAELVRHAVGVTAALGAVMVGDRPSTDGRFARQLGCRYAHVWSGVTARGMVVDPTPDLVGEDLGHVVRQLLGG